MSRQRETRYDHMLTGLAAGTLLPLFWYFALMSLFQSLETMEVIPPGGISYDFRTRTSALVAICLNMLPLQIFNRRNMERAMRGVVFPTVAYVMVWLYQFGASVI